MQSMLRDVAVLLCGVLFLGAHRAPPARSITVLAASSLREVLADVVPAFEKSDGVHVDLVLGASGQLAQQITAGSPGDVFVSASNEAMNALAKTDGIDATTRRVVATNALVLVVPATEASPKAARFEDLADAKVAKIAIGEPGSVPAGMYARQVLGHLKLEVGVAHKLVFGANVRQVADYVARGEVDAGIVYATDALAVPGLKVVATADAGWHEPIEYPAAVLGGAKDRDAARAFLAALAGEGGRVAFAKHGFKVAGPTTRP